MKKKKKTNTLPSHKSGGVSIREPSARQQVIADWSDDDEDAGEMLQQRPARMTAPTLMPEPLTGQPKAQPTRDPLGVKSPSQDEGLRLGELPRRG